MRTIRRTGLFIATLLITSSWGLSDALAQRGGARSALSNGNMGLGIALSTVSAGQDDLNGAIDDAVLGGANVKNLGSAWELSATWIYRLERSLYAFVFRPSYFTQSTDGSGAGGSYDYKLSGYSVFPIFRIYALENSFIKFFLQTGLGYGSLSGDIKAGADTLTFKGSAFGAMGGVGVDFCFTPSHCLTVEGNLRYLPIERNLKTGGSCTTSMAGIGQCNGEVERNGNDLKTTMSGVQGLVGYTMNF